MSRAYCYRCHRAKVACLCGRIDRYSNQVEIIVLQHPEETTNSKGSAIIAELGLNRYKCWVSEDFQLHKGLMALLEEKAGTVAILYPTETSEVLEPERVECVAADIKVLIVIDGTWRKARKIWELNPQLHTLPCYKLAVEQKSDYRIRKAPLQSCLSTVESIVTALRLIEKRPQSYQRMLDLFAEMIDFQIQKMGKDTYIKNYSNKNEINEK